MRTLLASGLGAAAATLTLLCTGAAAPKTSHPPEPAVPIVTAPPRVEYRFFVPSSGAAFTTEHERQLNELGAQGWKVVSPIYSGGMLNSYLMMREKR